MKKGLVFVLVSMLLLGLVAAVGAEGLQMGKAEYAAHGTRAVAIGIVTLDGDTIVAAYLDEYQFMPVDQTTPWPNSDQAFGQNYAAPEETALGSKRVNDAYYSNNMAERGGSTVSITDNFKAIEQFVVGMTISELEAFLNDNDSEAVVDAISGATVVDAHGYAVTLLLAAYDALNN